MKSYHLNKTFVIGVTLLFVGVGIQPTIATITSNYENEEECSKCRELSKFESALLKIQINRLEKYTKLLLKTSKNNPELNEKCNDLLKYINSVNAWRFPFLCNNILPKIMDKLLEMCYDAYGSLQYIFWFIILFYGQFYYSLCNY